MQEPDRSRTRSTTMMRSAGRLCHLAEIRQPDGRSVGPPFGELREGVSNLGQAETHLLGHAG